jgi:Predicted membrane protein
MGEFALFLAVFLACIVEAVEATTIVLAAGTARDWRSALLGVAGGLVVLAIIVAAAGPAITLLPLGVLRLVVGGLLLVFGLQWLRKAILRGSGYKALHDEEKIFQTELAEARAAQARSARGVRDWYAFTLSFKGVLLEGLEVVFIVLTFGTIQNKVATASLAAVIAVVLVGAAGFALRRPLARVPENTMKFIVGVMLASFGIFWGAEGAGAQWPDADLALIGIVPFVAIISLLLVAILRRRRIGALADQAAPTTVHSSARAVVHADASASAAGSAGTPVDVDGTTVPPAQPASVRVGFAGRMASFGVFWYDFIVGDDWRVTIGIVAAFALTFALAASGSASWWIVPAAVLILLPFSLARLVRAR